MLRLESGPFAPGSAEYYDEDPSFEKSGLSYIHVEIVIKGQIEIRTVARLDTAAPWVVLNSEISENLGLGTNGERVKLHTIAGEMEGTLERCPIMFTAKMGQSLEVEATIFVCDHWIRGNLLGYAGLLERIRFAIDPSSRQFHFGPVP